MTLLIRASAPPPSPSRSPSPQTTPSLPGSFLRNAFSFLDRRSQVAFLHTCRAWNIASYALVRLKYLTGTHDNPIYTSCRTIHDFFDQMFPPNRATPCLPTRRLRALAPRPSELEELRAFYRLPPERQRSDILSMITPRVRSSAREGERMLSENSRRIPPHLIALHLLLVSYPLFAKAWQIANRQRVLSIEERPDYFFPLPYMAGTGAIYQFESHTIVISESGNLRQKMNALIFETLNALQRRSPQEITRLALQRQIHREEYTVLMEWIENRSDHWINRIFSLPYRVSFSECWRRVNTPPRRGASSHADHFRRQWDDQIALTYLGISGDQPAESKTNG